MKSSRVQRSEVQRLWYGGHLALDHIYAELPASWEQIVLRYAEPQPDGTLRITAAAKRQILAACERSLIALDGPTIVALMYATRQAADLPRKAVD